MTRVADDVLGRIARQQADVFNRVRTGGLSPERFFRAIRQLLGDLLVRVLPRTWAVAVEAGGYDSVYINPEFTEADLPTFKAVEKHRRERTKGNEHKCRPSANCPRVQVTWRQRRRDSWHASGRRGHRGGRRIVFIPY